MATLSLETITFADQAAEYDLLMLAWQRRRHEAVPIKARAGGLLLALPQATIPPGRLQAGAQAGPRAMVGPSLEVEVALKRADGTETPSTATVQIVDSPGTLSDYSASLTAPKKTSGASIQAGGSQKGARCLQRSTLGLQARFCLVSQGTSQPTRAWSNETEMPKERP